MLMIRLLRYFLGSVSFSAEGGAPERFLNLASREGVNLWGIRRHNGTLRASVRARSFKKLRGPVRKSHVRLRITRKRGLPFLFHRYRKRSGIFAGAVVFLLLIWFLSGFIWTVEVTGNKTVEKQDILQALAEYGVKPGSYSPLLNIRSVEQKVLLKLPDLSWIAINLKGSTANVKVRERTYPSEVVDTSIPCNVKALYSGRIVKLEAYEGEALVKEGDAVVKGDVLVSGVIEQKSGVTRLAHASAEVIARTKHTLEETVKYKQKIRTETGKIVKRKELVVAGFSIPLYFGNQPAGDYTKSGATSYASLFGVKLPFGVKTLLYTEHQTRAVTLSGEEARRSAQKKLEADEKIEFSNATVTSRNYSVKRDSAGVSVKGIYLCEENIAYQEEIKIN